MTITLTSSDQIGEVNGVRGRIWLGATESGIPVQAFIASIAVRSDVGHDLSQFEQELKEHAPVSAVGFPLELPR